MNKKTILIASVSGFILMVGLSYTHWKRKVLNNQLVRAVLLHDVDGTRETLRQGSDPNFISSSSVLLTDVEGTSAFVIAASNDDATIVQILLDAGADVNLKLSYSRLTPLMMAAQNGRYEIVKMLLEKGAEVNIKDAKGNTALVYAAWEGHENVVDLLIHNHATVNPFSSNEPSALKRAEGNNHRNIVELLKQAGARY